MAYDKAHVAQIRKKLETAEGIGEFWRGMMLGALNAVDRQREQTDRYGIALMMIREGCADPPKVAGDALDKARAA